jgi:tRNA threonylcarbamoyl adenosine modification protein YeaZ
MMYLAIDTSTELTGVALVESTHLAAEQTWRCVCNQSVELLPHVVSLLEGIKSNIKKISGIIVARGPGGFNGLRVGIGTAKGLAFGLGVPVAGIGTLSAEAYRYAAAGLPVCAMLPAGRRELAWAVYRELGGKWLAVLPETVSPVEDIFSYVNSPTVFAGEPDAGTVQRLKDRLGKMAVFVESPRSRVHALAELGAPRLDAGDQDNVASLQPVYLRRPPITQPKKAHAIQLSTPSVIWDMDGVIVDSAEYHFKAWQRVFEKRGVAFSRENFRKTFGMVNKDIISYKMGKEVDPGEIGREKEELFRSLVVDGGVAPLPGAGDLIRELDRLGYRLAVASSAPRQNIELVLRLLGLTTCFQAVVSEEDVKRGKPDPQAFLLAAERLGALPSISVVIEDAPAGLQAARSAGMKAIGVTTSHSHEEMSAADIVAGSLEEVTPEDVLKLIKPEEE